MEEKLDNLSNRELIEMYNKSKDFINFLESEQKKTEKMEEE